MFPQHAVVRRYVERYAEYIGELIRLGTQVVDVNRVGKTTKLSITTRDILSQRYEVSVFDAVVVASGHYDDPLVPNVKGLKHFNATYPTFVLFETL